MNQRFIRTCLALALVLLISVSAAVGVLAAETYTTGLTADKAQATIGDIVHVTIRTTPQFAASEFAVNYDADKLTFEQVKSTLQGAACTCESGVIKIYDHGEVNTGDYVLAFTAKAAGNAKVELKEAACSSAKNAESGDLIPATIALDKGTVEISVITVSSFQVTSKPDGVFWGNSSVIYGNAYTFGVQTGFDMEAAAPIVTMGGVPVAVSNHGSFWSISNVTGDLVIETPKHAVAFKSNDPNIVVPTDTYVHYGQNYTFSLPSPITCIKASMKIGTQDIQELTASNAGIVTISGKAITDDIVITFAYAHSFEAPNYVWSDDYSTCTATRKCGNCFLEESETAKSQYETNSNGTKTFIAEFQNPAFSKQQIATNFGSTIRVTFRLIGDTVHDEPTGHKSYVTWIPTTSYQIEMGTYASDVFKKALSENGMSYSMQSAGYVSAVQAPSVLGGFWLSEKDNGKTAGWMYMVNGKYPEYAMAEYVLQDGDSIIFHYVDDISEEGSSKWREAPDVAPKAPAKGDLDKILTVGEGGKASPDKIQESDIGKDITFTFTPDKGYVIKDVIVDGVSKGSITSYTYKNLSYDSRIQVIFVKEGENWFVDVKESDWFCEDVRYVAEKGLFNGTDADHFSPYVPMNRAMLVTVLYRLEGSPTVTKDSEFTDVKRNMWYTDAVIWGTEHEIVKGYGNGKFGPTDPITREQMAAVLHRYATYKKYDTSASNSLTHYADFTDISPYALLPLKWANAEGLITGRTTTTLVPRGTATRAEVAAILHRFMENVAKN